MTRSVYIDPEVKSRSGVPLRKNVLGHEFNYAEIESCLSSQELVAWELVRQYGGEIAHLNEMYKIQ